MNFPTTRMRRLRYHPKLRDLIAETRLSSHDFILPLFIHYGSQVKNPILSMPGHYQQSVDTLEETIREILALQIPGIILFGIPPTKDTYGTAAYTENGIIQTAIRKIKALAPELLLISDCCFCEYTDHGHCGIIKTSHTDHEEVDNDATLTLLAKQAVSHAHAGADIIAPSGMMDGMVAAIRKSLDAAGFLEIPILGYAIKYASAFYGPFREAALGAPKFGDRKNYQMSPTNAREALREAALDINEGADLLMVKPALAYLDIIYRIKNTYPQLPLGAYQVSGEYAMLKAASQNGWIKEKEAVLETLISIKRAGADFIISYYAKEAAQWLRDYAVSKR